MSRRRIFLVDGASGTGKSDLVEYMATNSSAGIVKKLTTRPLRRGEIRRSLDLRFVSAKAFEDCRPDYRYKYGGYDYGFSRKDIDILLKKCKSIFVIVRSIPVMQQVKRDYYEYRVIAVYVHSDLYLILSRMIASHEKPEDVAFRIARVQNTFEDYVRHRNFFDEVIINNSDRATYHRLIAALIAKYASDGEADR